MKTCNSIKIRHILCIENKIVKDLMNAFLIDNEFTKILGQFKPIKIVDLFMTCNFQKILTFEIQFLYLIIIF
jgi:hypothetical protein